MTRGRNTLGGSEAAAKLPGKRIVTFDGKFTGYAYRLRRVEGEAVLERKRGKGPWRRMLFNRDVLAAFEDCFEGRWA